MTFMQSKDVDRHIQTSMIEASKKSLQDHSCVVVSGNPGEGKTSVGVALMKTLGNPNRCIMLSNARDWDSIHVSEVDIVFIDDIFGVHQLDNARLNDWMAILDKIQAYVSQSKLKLIIATRTHILKECMSKLERYRIFQHVILFSSEKLTAKEKTQIFQYWIHKSKRDCNEIHRKKVSVFGANEWSIGFPFCCFLVVNDDSLFINRYSFFSQPRLYLRKSLKTLEASKLLALACLLCKGGKMPIADFIVKKNKDRTMALLADLADIIGVETCPRLGTIKNCLDVMCGIYVETFRESYGFIHSVIGDAVALVLGTKDPHKIIELGSIDILCHNTCLDEQNNNTLIYIPEVCYKALAQRLVYELSNFEIDQVVKHPAFLNKTFVKILFQHLETSNSVDIFLKYENRKIGYMYGDQRQRVFSSVIQNSLPADVVEVFMKNLGCTHSHQEGLNLINCWKCKEKQVAFEQSIPYCDEHVLKFFLDTGVAIKANNLLLMICYSKNQALKHAVAMLKRTQMTQDTIQECLNRALCDAYRLSRGDFDIIDTLLNSGAVVCLNCVHQSAKNEALFSHALDHLLKDAVVDSFHMHSVLHWAYEQDYSMTETKLFSKEIPSLCCIIPVALSGNSTKLRTILENIHKKLSLDSNDYICNEDISRATNHALRIVYSKGNVDIINVLKDFEAVESLDCLFTALSYGYTELVQEMIQDPTCVQDALSSDKPILTKAMHCSNWNLVVSLLEAGAKPTMDFFLLVCEVFLRTKGDKRPPLALVTHTLRILQQNNLWDPFHWRIERIMKDAYSFGNEAMQKILVGAGVEPTLNCLAGAVNSCSIMEIDYLIKRLLELKQWYTNSEAMTRCLVNCYVCQRTDALSLLKANGALIDCSILTQIVCQCHIDQVKRFVTELKNAHLWNVEHPSVLNAYNYSITFSEPKVTRYLEHEGVNADMSTILHCMEQVFNYGRASPTADEMQVLIIKLQVSGRWNGEDKRLQCCFEKSLFTCSTLKGKHFFYFNVLCKAGFKLSKSILQTAVQRGSTQLVEKLIDLLDDTNSISSGSDFAQSLLVTSMENDNMDMAQFLVSGGYAYVTDDLLPKLIQTQNSTNNWLYFIMSCLENSGDWNPAKDVVVRLFDTSFTFYDKKKGASLRQVLMKKGVHPTFSSIIVAVKNQSYIEVPDLIKHMKIHGTWNGSNDAVASALEHITIDNYVHHFDSTPGTKCTGTTALAHLLLAEGAIPTERCFLSTIYNMRKSSGTDEEVSLLRNMINNLRTHAQKESIDKLFEEAFEISNTYHYFGGTTIVQSVLIQEGVIATDQSLPFAIQTTNENLLTQIINRSKQANEWVNCMDIAVKALESTMCHSFRYTSEDSEESKDKDFVLANILLKEGVVPTTDFLHNILKLYKEQIRLDILDNQNSEEKLQFLKTVINKMKQGGKWEPNNYLLQCDLSHLLESTHFVDDDGNPTNRNIIPDIGKFVEKIVKLNTEHYNFQSIFGDVIGQERCPVPGRCRSSSTFSPPPPLFLIAPAHYLQMPYPFTPSFLPVPPPLFLTTSVPLSHHPNPFSHRPRPLPPRTPEQPLSTSSVPVSVQLAWVMFEEGMFPFELCLRFALDNLNLNIFHTIIDRINTVAKSTDQKPEIDIIVQKTTQQWMYYERYEWYSWRLPIPEEIFNVVKRQCDRIACNLNIERKTFESLWDTTVFNPVSLPYMEEAIYTQTGLGSDTHHPINHPRSDTQLPFGFAAFKSTEEAVLKLCQLNVHPDESKLYTKIRIFKSKTLFVDEGVPFYYIVSGEFLIEYQRCIPFNTKLEHIDLVNDIGQVTFHNVMWKKLEARSVILKRLVMENKLPQCLAFYASVLSENPDLVDNSTDLEIVAKGQDLYCSDLFYSCAIETVFFSPITSFGSPAMKTIREIFIKKGIPIFFECSKRFKLVNPLPSNRYLLLERNALQFPFMEVLYSSSMKLPHLSYITFRDRYFPLLL